MIIALISLLPVIISVPFLLVGSMQATTSHGKLIHIRAVKVAQ
jgi:hypothetical protein